MGNPCVPGPRQCRILVKYKAVKYVSMFFKTMLLWDSCPPKNLFGLICLVTPHKSNVILISVTVLFPKYPDANLTKNVTLTGNNLFLSVYIYGWIIQHLLTLHKHKRCGFHYKHWNSLHWHTLLIYDTISSPNPSKILYIIHLNISVLKRGFPLTLPALMMHNANVTEGEKKKIHVISTK